jgi:HAD superfamily hydrolase (TIGR01549 family)
VNPPKKNSPGSGSRPTIRVIITDLDDTLYDWVAMWHAQFTAEFDVVSQESKIDKDTILQEWKRVHEKRGTSEYVFAVEELPSLRRKYSEQQVKEIAGRAFRAGQKARQKALKLFPEVLDVLTFLKEKKECMIVGFTESKSYYVGQRVRALGLDGIMEYLYSSEHTELSAMAKRRLSQPPYNEYEMKKTEVRYTPIGVAKPNPKILQKILKDLGADPKETLYIGDKLDRDVIMAQAAGTIDVHASYGEAKDRPEYELLRKVTHWTKAAVERERNTGVEKAVPAYTIQTFGDLLRFFRFARFVEPRKKLSKDDEHATVQAWKKTVDVQQHFNDLEMRIRNIALTVTAAIIGAIGLGVSQPNLAAAYPWYSSLLAGSALGLWIAFYFMDRRWYHRLLYGAVRHGEFIEQRCRIVLPELQLTKTISQQSPSQKLGRVFHSTDKLDIFYGLVAVGLLLVFEQFLWSALGMMQRLSIQLTVESALLITIAAGIWFVTREPI